MPEDLDSVLSAEAERVLGKSVKSQQLTRRVLTMYPAHTLMTYDVQLTNEKNGAQRALEPCLGSQSKTLLPRESASGIQAPHNTVNYDTIYLVSSNDGSDIPETLAATEPLN